MKLLSTLPESKEKPDLKLIIPKISIISATMKRIPAILNNESAAKLEEFVRTEVELDNVTVVVPKVSPMNIAIMNNTMKITARNAEKM